MSYISTWEFLRTLQLDLEQVCCPDGYIFDVSAGESIEGFETKALLQKTSALVTKKSAALQPPLRPYFLYHDGKKCQPWETRCLAGPERRVCCPVTHGVCCGHGFKLFCCPASYHCDIPRKYCVRQI